MGQGMGWRFGRSETDCTLAVRRVACRESDSYGDVKQNRKLP